MEEEIREFIIFFFSERGKYTSQDGNEFLRINFVEAKLLDSIEFITLIAEIEDNFNIVFTEEEIQSPMFSSIEGIVKITNSKSKIDKP